MIRRVRERVPARLEYALLFGSKARGEARSDSDVDLLFVFERLPPDREPQASIVEEITAGVCEMSRLDLSPWSVALVDLECGMRTPMLVDAVADAVALWPRNVSVPRVRFTPADALRCSAALLHRVEEGSEEAALRSRCGDTLGLSKRMRDDLVRLCTAGLLLAGETRPRRAEAVERFLARTAAGRSSAQRFLLNWVADSYGADGRDETLPVVPPPLGFRAAAREVDRLRSCVAQARRRVLAVQGFMQREELDTPAPGTRGEGEGNRFRRGGPSCNCSNLKPVNAVRSAPSSRSPSLSPFC